MTATRLPTRSILSRFAIAAAMAFALIPAIRAFETPLLPTPPPGLQLQHTLRIRNASQYQIVSLKVAGVQLLGPGQSLGLLGLTSAAIPSGPQVVEAGLGIRLNSGAMKTLITVRKPVVVPSAGTVSVVITPVGLVDVLTGFSSSRRWVGNYVDTHGIQRSRTYLFLGEGTWTLREGKKLIGSGRVSVDTWLNNAFTLDFAVSEDQVFTLNLARMDFVDDEDIVYRRQ